MITSMQEWLLVTERWCALKSSREVAKIKVTYLAHSDLDCCHEDCYFKAQVVLYGVTRDFNMCATHAAEVFAHWENLVLQQYEPRNAPSKGNSKSIGQPRLERDRI